MVNEIENGENLFLVSEGAQTFIQTDKKVKIFESVKCKRNEGTMSLLECIKIIVKGKTARADVQNGTLSIGDQLRTYNDVPMQQLAEIWLNGCSHRWNGRDNPPIYRTKQEKN